MMGGQRGGLKGNEGISFVCAKEMLLSPHREGLGFAFVLLRKERHCNQAMG